MQVGDPQLPPTAPRLNRVAARVHIRFTYGCSLGAHTVAAWVHLWLQPGVHTVAAWAHLRLQVGDVFPDRACMVLLGLHPELQPYPYPYPSP